MHDFMMQTVLSRLATGPIKCPPYPASALRGSLLKVFDSSMKSHDTSLVSPLFLTRQDGTQPEGVRLREVHRELVRRRVGRRAQLRPCGWERR